MMQDHSTGAPALPTFRTILLQVVWVPGAYEIPVVASAMARSGRFDAVVAIGTVVCAP